MRGLLPLSGVDADGVPDRFVATTGEPWLELLGLDLARLRGGMVEVTYRASLLDQPARPLIRFFLDDGSRVDRIAPAPIAGAGVWVGRMPAGTRRVAISPTGRPGCFGFRVERVRGRVWLGLLAEGAGRRPRQTRSALLTRLIGWAPESDSNLAWAIGAFDLDSFPGWSRYRARESEPDGLESPRGVGTPIVLLLPAEDGGTVASLVGQLHRDWTLLVVEPARGSPGHSGPAADPRILRMDAEAASRQLAGLPSGTLVASLMPGDRLPPYALAFLAEQRRREPGVGLFYGDEIVGGTLALKPGWSPRLMAAHPYLGRAAFASPEGWDEAERRAFVARGTLPRRLLDDEGSVRALRRVLLHAAAPASVGEEASVPHHAEAVPPCPAAAIIVPTCDQPALLRRLVDSIRSRSVPGSYRLVVVDNGRDDGPGRDQLAALAAADDAIVLRRTDAFNFSDFCNRAAAACDEPLLVFLNDDMEILSEGWLPRLGRLASQEGVGAVGARLTYPDGRLQHVGVLVGMGGSAGHLEALAAGDDPGWLGRNAVPHEMSAVTGACLAVARDKFLAVGGFDAEALPVELSDVDLCLKLNARGWQTLVDPQVHLMHEESASRGGATFRRLTKYSRQRDIFIERWRHVLRDDPFFHPGLSLYSLDVALG